MFAQKLNQAILQKKSRVCVGLDPRLDLLPEEVKADAIKQYGETFEGAAEAIRVFNRQVIDVIEPFAPVVKPQLAFYEQYGPAGMEAFLDTVQYAHDQGLLVVADAKRGDIDSTAQAYAQAFLGETTIFSQKKPAFNLDCITVNPFLGQDSLKPFLDVSAQFGKGLFILVKTSNPGSKDIQDLKFDGKTLSEEIAQWVARYSDQSNPGEEYGNIGAVVGATFPEEAKKLRKLMPRSIFLVPGIGSQGGALDALGDFFQADGLGAIVNSSRGIVFPDEARGRKDYLKIIASKAQELRDGIEKVLTK